MSGPAGGSRFGRNAKVNAGNNVPEFRILLLK